MALSIELVLASLMQPLARSVAKEVPRAMRASLSTPDANAALAQCLQGALLVLLTPKQTHTSAETQLVAAALPALLAERDVDRQLARLTEGEAPRGSELAAIFDELNPQHPSRARGLDMGVTAQGMPVIFERIALALPALRDAPALKPMFDALARRNAGIPTDQLADLDAAIKAAGQNSMTVGGSINAANVVNGAFLQRFTYNVYLAPQAPSWESAYLRALIRECDPLNLSPIDEARGEDENQAGLRVTISDVYVALNLHDIKRAVDKNNIPMSIAASIEALRNSESAIYKQKADFQWVSVTALEAMVEYTHVALLGAPGSGKSSVINHLAVLLARRRLQPSAAHAVFPGWPADLRPLPLRIVLREFAGWQPPPDIKRGSAGHVWAFAEAVLRGFGCAEAVPELKRAFLAGEGIVFFDGLDEVRGGDGDAQRGDILNAITAFSAAIGASRCVVTCRSYAYANPAAGQPDWRLDAARFHAFTLAELDDAQIQTFAQSWYAKTAPARGWSEAHAKTLAGTLITGIQGRPYLGNLAGNPLLLTLMAQVHGVDGNLPDDRAELYRRAVHLLLDKWEARLWVDPVTRQRQTHNGVYQSLGITPRELQERVLQPVAYAVHKAQAGQAERSGNNAANIPADVLTDALTAALPKANGKPDLNRARDAIEFIQQRAGLLVARARHLYAFPHRTFQEFLAAQYIRALAEPAEHLRELLRVDTEWWHEVFLWVAASNTSTPSMINTQIEFALGLDDAAPNTADAAARAGLVAQAIRETNFLAKAEREPIYEERVRECRNRLLSQLTAHTMLPTPIRARAGASLAQIGDPRFYGPDKLCLRADPLLGFVHVPALRDFRIGTRKADFERVMQGVGVDKGDQKSFKDEINDATCQVHAFHIGEYPVTVAQWRAYCKASGFNPGQANSLTGSPNAPVIYVSWHEAVAYCTWLNDFLPRQTWCPGAMRAALQQKQLHVTLPSELEWERAARFVPADGSSHAYIFPWGNKVDRAFAHYASGDGTIAVGAFAKHGAAHDMIGNVWEWTRSKFLPYPYTDAHSRESLTDINVERVLRGGTWHLNEGNARCAARSDILPADRDQGFGFRVALSPFVPPSSVHSGL